MNEVIEQLTEDIRRFNELSKHSRSKKLYADASRLRGLSDYAEIILRTARKVYIESQAIEDTQGLIKKDLLLD